jgi:hypothetical protein
MRYGPDLSTKANRLEYQASIFDTLIFKGYERENYGDIAIFTMFDGRRWLLQIYKGTATNFLTYTSYRDQLSMTDAIARYKKSSDNRFATKVIQKVTPTYTSAAMCAKAIRIELKMLYPDIKFSVTSQTYSGGCSVGVSYTNGPTSKEIESIISKYQYGRFDGMTDIYEITNSIDDLPQAKYVGANRKCSEDIYNACMDDAIEIMANDRFGRVHSPHELIYAIFHHYAIPANDKVIGLMPTGVRCGLASPEVFYKFQFESNLFTL